MKKFASVCFAAAAVLAATGVNAQTISPTGSFTISGSAVMQQSTTANCTISAAGTNTSTAGTITSRSFPSGTFGLCGPLGLVQPYGAWSFRVAPGQTNKIYLKVGANTVLNKPCYGEVLVDWDNATSKATFNNNVLPAVNAGDPSCTLVSGGVIISAARTIS
ncbi:MULTISPECIES: hypothetical protein [unclassified Brevundimonas]|uniref:hypothetical protein n=1 Tax=unclassified Brevundimonas TaxID=2622653 RepID=UPI000F95CD62|nr:MULTISPECIES: hypothetical protein [unclassified Brevundimonas]